MEPQKLKEQIDAIEIKLEQTYQAVEKIRWYMKLTAWVTIIVVVLPLLGLLFAIPTFISLYVDPLSGL